MNLSPPEAPQVGAGQTSAGGVAEAGVKSGAKSSVRARGARASRLAGIAERLNPVPMLQAAPLAVVLCVFLLLPMLALVVVSFFDYDSVQIIPAFQLTNYTDVLGSAVTWRTYVNTLRYTVIVWAVTVVLGFTVAYVLAFEIRSKT